MGLAAVSAMRHLILGIGTVVVDDVVRLDRLPPLDTKAPIRERWRQVGGPVPTALVAASRLGSPCVFAGKWGDDAEGETIEADLQSEGIDLSQSVREPGGRSGFAQVWVDASPEGNGARSIAFFRGEFTPLAPMADLPATLAILHVDGAHGAAAVSAAEQARARGARVVLDAGSMKSHTERLFALADVLVASRQFFEAVTKETEVNAAASALRRRGVVGSIVLTCGAEGSWMFSERADMSHQPAIAVDALDTTGAGDVFCGGLIHGLAAGRSLADSVRLGTAVAAYKCAGLGNRVLPDWPTLTRSGWLDLESTSTRDPSAHSV